MTKSRHPTITSRATLLLLLWTMAVMVASEDNNEEYQRRTASKPWLMREFELIELPESAYDFLVSVVEFQTGIDNPMDYVPRTIFVSPFTIFFVILVLANLWSWVSYHLSGSWVEASHILVKDTSPKTLKGLLSLQEYIGKNAKNFGITAKQYSQCPSSEQNGDLGRFGPGVMAPPFDKICFDPATPLNTTLGPVQTQFGYHLIYIRNRKL